MRKGKHFNWLNARGAQLKRHNNAGRDNEVSSSRALLTSYIGTGTNVCRNQTLLNDGEKSLECAFLPEEFLPNKPTILVVPNNCGIMKYAIEVVLFLHSLTGWNIISPNFSGQGANEGLCSLETATMDVDWLLQQLVSKGFVSEEAPLAVLAHCSGLFPLLGIEDRIGRSLICGMIIYHYLHTPSQVYDVSLRAMDELGIRRSLVPIQRDACAYPAVTSFSCPTLIVHPYPEKNISRATFEELRMVNQNKRPCFRITTPPDGYDISDLPQGPKILHTLRRDILPTFVACMAFHSSRASAASSDENHSL